MFPTQSANATRTLGTTKIYKNKFDTNKIKAESGKFTSQMRLLMCVGTYFASIPGNCFLIECGGRKSAAPMSSRPHANDWQKRTRGARNQFQSLLHARARCSGGSSRCGGRALRRPAAPASAPDAAPAAPRIRPNIYMKEAEIVNKRSIILRGRLRVY